MTTHITSQTRPQTRIDLCFTALKKKGEKALVTFITAGDPDYETSLKLLKALPEAGADIIELGMPFSDPMADGPAIQLASQRALKSGQTMNKTLQMVREFRKDNNHTPIVLMGYYNPVYSYGGETFLEDAKAAGVDGLIIVDLPPEADEEFCIPALEKGLSFIRLATPTTDGKRLPAVLQNTSGFLYYVSIAGITGTKAPDPRAVHDHVRTIKSRTDLPVVVGFGVKTPEQARALSQEADGVVIGSALVSALAQTLSITQKQDCVEKATESTVQTVTNLVKSLAEGLKSAQK